MSLERNYHGFILLNVGRATHHADWNWKNICSPFARIHFIETGTAKIICENESHILRKGCLYLTPPYTKHSYECEDDLSLYYIHIYEDLGRHWSVFDSVDFPVEVEADPLTMELVKRLATINPKSELPYYDPDFYDNPSMLSRNIANQKNVPLSFEWETQGILKQIFSRFLFFSSEKNLNIDDRILKALHFIHSHLDQAINIGDLARICFLTEDHFIRLFKRNVNYTPGKYINLKKIEKAQLMMLIDDMSVKDLSYSLGFDNVSYFNHLFKKITGENPGGYKRRMHALH